MVEEKIVELMEKVTVVNGQFNRECATAYIVGRFHGVCEAVRSQPTIEGYDFEDQLELGQIGETEIDEFLAAKGNDLHVAPAELQQYGIDRICVSEVLGYPYFTSMEYKTDHRAADTGNLFIETIIRERDSSISPGWLRKTVSQKLVFYLPNTRWLILMSTAELREWIFTNGTQLQQSAWVENKGGYAGRGLLFPMTTGRRVLKSWLEFRMDNGT